VAAALEHYYRLAHNIEAERQCCEIRLRAERRHRQIYAAGDKAQGTRGQLVGPGIIGGPGIDPPINEGGARSLAELGISKSEADRGRKLAAMSDEAFEAALTQPGKLTSNGAAGEKAKGGKPYQVTGSET
jgi:hypothetical protein